MENTPAAGRGDRPFRGVKDQRAHEQRAPTRNAAGDAPPLAVHCVDRPGEVEVARCVGTGHDEQRAVGFIAVIQVQADGEHIGEHAHGRADVMDAGLDGPRAEAGNIDSFAHCDGGVSVPGDIPVRGSVFVKEERARDEGGWAEDGLDESAHRG